MKSERGFTLIEIVVALVLMASASAFALYSFSSSSKLAKTDAPIAYNFGRGVLEQLYENVRWDQWAIAGLPLSLAPAPHSQVKVLVGTTYTSNYVVNDFDANGVADGVARDVNGDGQEDFRKVDLAVSW